MEFEAAAQRLAKDQSKLKARNKGGVMSVKAKRQAEFRKKQQEQLRLERQRQQVQREYVQSYMNACDRKLGVKTLSSSSSSTNKSEGLHLMPTSIWGDGDKIALPPSVLEYLTTAMEASHTSPGDDTTNTPWTFRIGILRRNYTFPSSPLLQSIQPPNDDDDDDDDDMMEDDNHEAESNDKTAAYMDEMSHKYLSYTYASVVEFTQEENYVGLPASIATRLLVNGVPSTRTKDPAAAANDDDDKMTTMQQHDDRVDDEEERTPGHLAWGAFDVPNMPIEVTLVKLPRGRRCTVIPTMDAIRNGFHNLKDIKLVLEQSLSRTRATLSVHDLVHTWNRGTKYDLHVASVTPSDYRAIRIINTDLEVDIGINEEFEQERNRAMQSTRQEVKAQETSAFATTGTGRVLSGPSTTTSQATSMDVEQPSQQQTPVPVDLLPEPPLDQTEGVCTVQLRGDAAAGRRRFVVATATLQDLFAFAATLSQSGDVNSFQLVTRFPRRVLALGDYSDNKSLADCGIQAGQEMFMLERL